MALTKDGRYISIDKCVVNNRLRYKRRKLYGNEL